jgi:hypothetical protein
MNAAGGLVGYNPALGTSPGFSGAISVSPAPEPATIISGLTAMVLVGGTLGARRVRRSERRPA